MIVPYRDIADSTVTLLIVLFTVILAIESFTVALLIVLYSVTVDSPLQGHC